MICENSRISTLQTVLKGYSSIPDTNELLCIAFIQVWLKMIKASHRPSSSSASWEALKWVRYRCRMGWHQAVVYRRRKAANFHWAEDRSGQPPLAAYEQEWTLYVWHVCTCNGSRAGAPKQENSLVCAHQHTHWGSRFSLRRLIKTDQNATFTFVTLKGN